MGERRKLSVSAKKNNSSVYLRLLDSCIPKYMSVFCDSRILLWAWKLTSINFSLSHFIPTKIWMRLFAIVTQQVRSVPITASSMVRIKLSNSSGGIFLPANRPLLCIFRKGTNCSLTFNHNRRKPGNKMKAPTLSPVSLHLLRIKKDSAIWLNINKCGRN